MAPRASLVPKQLFLGGGYFFISKNDEERIESMLTTRPRGTNDFLPGEVEKWQTVEALARQVCAEYGYKEIRTPIFEHT